MLVINELNSAPTARLSAGAPIVIPRDVGSTVIMDDETTEHRETPAFRELAADVALGSQEAIENDCLPFARRWQEPALRGHATTGRVPGEEWIDDLALDVSKFNS